MIERPHHVAMVRRLLSEKLDSLDVIHAGQDTFPLARKIRAVSLLRLGDAA